MCNIGDTARKMCLLFVITECIRIQMDSRKEPDEKLIELLEKQKKDLVFRMLQKHEEVQAEKIFSEKILASLPDLFFVTTADFMLVKVNEEFRRLLGFSPTNAKTFSLADFIPENAFSRIKELIASSEIRNFETEFQCHDGEKIRVRLNGSTYISESGSILHMMIAKDMSDVHRMMTLIREAQEQLIHSERLASLGEMAAGIGHELTQPLNAILLYARNCIKCLNGVPLDKTLLEENLEIIIDRVKKASSIIKSLKSFARKEEPATYPVDVNTILTNILKFLDNQIKLSDIEINLDLGDVLTTTLGNDVRLEQVFLNIIQNAIQAMGETESPRLSIRTFPAKAIDPESFLEKEYVVTEIKDNGAGIQQELLGKIFDPFFTTREVGLGMGLGLSIVDRIVRIFSGFIKVESTHGVGTCFSVHLPAYREKEIMDA